MRHESEIHRFLHGRRRDHRIPRLTAGHDVGMIAKDVQRMRRERTGGHVHDHGQKFARNLIHIGDHQEQTLRRRIGSGERACGKGPVNGARRAAFRLHLRDFELLAPHIGAARGCPFVGGLRHRRRGSDGVDGGNFRERIRDVRCSGIAVDGHFFHQKSLRLYNIVFMSGADKNIPAVSGGKSCPAPALFHIQ